MPVYEVTHPNGRVEFVEAASAEEAARGREVTLRPKRITPRRTGRQNVFGFTDDEERQVQKDIFG